MSNLPGRNDPCLCGSGKKFKKCCIDQHRGKKSFTASVLGSKGDSLLSRVNALGSLQKKDAAAAESGHTHGACGCGHTHS